MLRLLGKNAEYLDTFRCAERVYESVNGPETFSSMVYISVYT